MLQIMLLYTRNRTKVPATHKQKVINYDSPEQEFSDLKLRTGDDRSLPSVLNTWKPPKPRGTSPVPHL